MPDRPAIDAEAEAVRAWLELVVACRRLHRDLSGLVRAGRLSLGPFGDLEARLAEADAALHVWTAAADRCDPE
jgi:hypothetical protein